MGDKGLSLQRTTTFEGNTAPTSPNDGVQISLNKTAAVQTYFKIQELPAEILFNIADHLDTVSRVCLNMTNTYLRDSITDVPKELSPCARIRVRRHLSRDRAFFSNKVLIREKEINCREYTGHKYQHSYCEVCRCGGHMEFCKACGVRTCAREDELRWNQWARNESARQDFVPPDTLSSEAIQDKAGRTEVISMIAELHPQIPMALG